MSVLFVGGTAEQCIAAAILQQRGINCNVVGACRELGAPWIAVPISALCNRSGAGTSSPDALPIGLSVISSEFSWTEAEQQKLAPLGYECITEMLPLNSPLILVSSLANMGEYYRFIFLEEPLSLCNGKISRAAVSVASLIRSEAYTITQRRNIIRLLKALEQYIKAFHLSYIEFTDREDAELQYLAVPDEAMALRQFEERNVKIGAVGEYFKVPHAFFSQLLCVPAESLANLTFADLLRGVVSLYQSLGDTRSRCVLEYGFSDIPQAFVRILFCQGGLGIPGCSAEIDSNAIHIKPAMGDDVKVAPEVIYISDTPLIAPVLQVFFILRDTDGELASHLRAHVAPHEPESTAANDAHIPINFVCILSNYTAIVRVGDGTHLRRGFLSVAVCCSCKAEDSESIAAIAHGIQESVRAELPQFMSIGARQFRAAECAVFATHYNQDKSVLQSNIFTDGQLLDLEKQCTVKHQSKLFTSVVSAHSVSTILTGATFLIKDVLGDSVGDVSGWVTDLKRTARIDACKQLFHRIREKMDKTNLDEIEQDFSELIDRAAGDTDSR